MGKKKKVVFHKRWTRREINLVKRRYPTCSTSELAGKLGKTVSAVTQKANKLHIHKNAPVCWSHRETVLLRKFHPMESNFRLAQMLGRSQRAVENKASKMGLRKSPYSRKRQAASKHRNVLPGRVRRG